jgi:hypothetical protein
MPDKYNLGDDVRVQFNIKGTKWVKEGKENFITNLDAWRMEGVKLGQDIANANEYFDMPPTQDAVDDLPF